MMSKSMVKVICIIMAILMVLSVGAVVLQVFAADESLVAANMSVVPATGDNDGDYIIPAGIAVAAILAVVVCLVLPKFKKKDGEAISDDADDSDDSDVSDADGSAEDDDEE